MIGEPQMRKIAVVLYCSIVVGRVAFGQTPAGTVARVVQDSSGVQRQL